MALTFSSPATTAGSGHRGAAPQILLPLQPGTHSGSALRAHHDLAAERQVARQLSRDDVRAGEDATERCQPADLAGEAQELPVQGDAGVIGVDVDRQLTRVRRRIGIRRPGIRRPGILVVRAARAERIAIEVEPIAVVRIRRVVRVVRVVRDGDPPPVSPSPMPPIPSRRRPLSTWRAGSRWSTRRRPAAEPRRYVDRRRSRTEAGPRRGWNHGRDAHAGRRCRAESEPWRDADRRRSAHHGRRARHRDSRSGRKGRRSGAEAEPRAHAGRWVSGRNARRIGTGAESRRWIARPYAGRIGAGTGYGRRIGGLRSG
jgi:hypothetical protein